MIRKCPAFLMRGAGFRQDGLNVSKRDGHPSAEETLGPKEVAKRLKVPKSWVLQRLARAARTRFRACGSVYIRFDWAAVVKGLTGEAAAGGTNLS